MPSNGPAVPLMKFQDINWAAHTFQSIVGISAGYRASLNKSNTCVITTFSFQMPHDLFYLLWNFFQLSSPVPGLHTFVNDVSIAEMPYNYYFEYFGPDFKLHINPSYMTNQNTHYICWSGLTLFDSVSQPSTTTICISTAAGLHTWRCVLNQWQACLSLCNAIEESPLIKWLC